MNFISIGDVCTLLGISLSTAYCWIKLGKLKEFFIVKRHYTIKEYKQCFLIGDL